MLPALEDEELLQVLNKAWRSPFTTRSNTAREHPELIAQAACLGFITTRQGRETWGALWHVTSAGLRLIEEAVQ